MWLNCCRSFGTHGDGKRPVIGVSYLIFNNWKMRKVLDFVKEKSANNFIKLMVLIML